MLLLLTAPPVFCADRKQLLEQQKQQALEAIKKKPLLDKTRVEDVFAIRREGTDLVVHTFMTPAKFYQEMRAEFEGLPFPATVHCQELSRDVPSVDFEFEVESWPQPLIHAMLHLKVRPGSLTMERHLDIPESDATITLTQDGNHVELDLYNSDAGSRSSTVKMRADTFLELRRQHPLEVESYLRPLFRDMRQEAALAPEPHEAWQILADDWPVDESLKEKVQPYLAALDDNDFRVRSAAADKLFRLGRPAAVYMLRMDRAGLSPEQGLRLDEVIGRYKPLPESRAAKLHDDLHFLTDCLDCDDPMVRRLALDRLKKLTGRDLEFDVDAKANARMAAANEVRDQLFKPDGTPRAKS